MSQPRGFGAVQMQVIYDIWYKVSVHQGEAVKND